MNAPLTHTVALIHSDAEALDVAEALAQVLTPGSAERDRERRLPHSELELFSHSGLWAISVPKAFGGAGVSSVTLAKVICDNSALATIQPSIMFKPDDT